MINKYISQIEDSLNKAYNDTSKINDDILNIPGMTGIKTRHFYNNICSYNDVRYLEVGAWKGSSISSAMFNNKIKCVCIDNWSEFGGPKNEFLENFNKFKGENDATFIEKNCWDVEPSSIGNINIYMFDGDHSSDSHYKSLNHFLPCLDDEFIFIIDDWNWEQVRNATLKSISDNNLEICYKKEILTPYTDFRMDNCRNYTWWNGICIFVLKK
jgi:hypothetical protein